MFRTTKKINDVFPFWAKIRLTNLISTERGQRKPGKLRAIGAKLEQGTNFYTQILILIYRPRKNRNSFGCRYRTICSMFLIKRTSSSDLFFFIEVPYLLATGGWIALCAGEEGQLSVTSCPCLDSVTCLHFSNHAEWLCESLPPSSLGKLAEGTCRTWKKGKALFDENQAKSQNKSQKPSDSKKTKASIILKLWTWASCIILSLDQGGSFLHRGGELCKGCASPTFPKVPHVEKIIIPCPKIISFNFPMAMWPSDSPVGEWRLCRLCLLIFPWRTAWGL